MDEPSDDSPATGPDDPPTDATDGDVAPQSADPDSPADETPSPEGHSRAPGETPPAADDHTPQSATHTSSGGGHTHPPDDRTQQAAGPAGAPADGRSTVDVSKYVTDDRSLTATVQLIWAVRVLVAVAILGVVARVFLPQYGLDPSLVTAGVVALAVVALVWVHLRYRIWRYRIREDALYLERGVVTNVRTVVPYVRIQHVDTQRGPMERFLGLSTLVVYTAGSRGADVSIPGLTTKEATDLQKRVKELAIEAEGGDAL